MFFQELTVVSFSFYLFVLFIELWLSGLGFPSATITAQAATPEYEAIRFPPRLLKAHVTLKYAPYSDSPQVTGDK